MSSFNRLSDGRVVYSPKALLASHWFNSIYPKTVSLPVGMTTSLVGFDFKSEFEKMDPLQNRSAASIDRLVKLMGKTLDHLSDEEMEVLLRKHGFKGLKSQEITEIVQQMRMKIRDTFTKSAIPSIVLRDVLRQEGNKNLLQSLGSLGYGDVVGGVALVQELYGKFALSTSLDDVISYVTVNMTSNTAYKYVRSLYNIFQRTPGATIQARMSYVADTILKSTADRTFVKTEPMLDGIAYEISEIDFMGADDLTFIDSLVGFFMSMRSVMGLETNTGALSVSMDEFAREMVIGIGEFLPYLPQEFLQQSQPNFLNIQKLITDLWTLRVIERVASDDPGGTEARINNIMDARKYTRQDAYDEMIRESVTISSIMYESFLDVAAMFKDLATNRNVYFDDLTPKKQVQYSTFMFSYLERYKNYNIGTNHPRFLNEAAHVINHGFTFMASEAKWIVKDRYYDGTKRFLVDPNDFSYKELLKSPHVKGHYIDAPMGFDYRLINLAQDYKPSYSLTIAAPDVLASQDVFKIGLGMVPFQQVKDTGYYRYFLDFCSLEQIMTVEEFMQKFSVPMEIARAAWKGQMLYANFKSLNAVHLFWDSDVAPIYEMREVEGGETDGAYRMDPFVAEWPYMIDRVVMTGELKTGRGAIGNAKDSVTVEIQKAAKPNQVQEPELKQRGIKTGEEMQKEMNDRVDDTTITPPESPSGLTEGLDGEGDGA